MAYILHFIIAINQFVWFVKCNIISPPPTMTRPWQLVPWWGIKRCSRLHTQSQWPVKHVRGL